MKNFSSLNAQILRRRPLRFANSLRRLISKKMQLLLLYTLQHFAVDGICGATLASCVVNELHLESIIYCFGIYNLIAFGSQFLFGYLLDKRTIFLPYAPIFSLMLLGLGTVSALGVLSQVILLGLGNSIFHVSVGSQVLRRWENYKELGIFVSSGAIGLALGLNLFVDEKIFLLIYVSITAIIFIRDKKVSALESNENSPQKIFNLPMSVGFVCIILLLGCVVLRSFGGSNTSTEYVMLFPCVFAVGKILGGICCDKLGCKNTIGVIFIIGFLSLQWNGTLPAVILTLAFNMTMPLTLRLVHWCNPAYPAMMFGLAAGCLLPGAFFKENFTIAIQAMVVLQFLILFAAWKIFNKRTAEVL